MDLLPLGLAFLVGAVFGYAACLWRWCAAEEARDRAAKPRSTVGREDVLARGVKFTGVPLPPPGATQTRIYGGAGTSFVVAHDCVAERCPVFHGGVRPADHTSCSRRRFGSGCVPFVEDAE